MAQQMTYDGKGNSLGKRYSGPNAPKVDRQRRAQELQERMAATGLTVAQREHARGHHGKCSFTCWAPAASS